MRYFAISLFGFAAGCSFPQHIAKKTIEDSMPAAEIRELHCKTHNGTISIEGVPGLTEVRMTVHVSVRGHSQAEADANLEQVDVRRETMNGRLTLAGQYDLDLSKMSPSFSFVVEAPPALVMQLESHNGDIRAKGIDGNLACETHNGAILASSKANEVRMHSHNGGIDAELDGTGSLAASITTHNGDVAVTASGMSTAIDVSTHNGTVSLRDTTAATARSKRHVQVRFGAGEGRLDIQTHNGDVVIR